MSMMSTSGLKVRPARLEDREQLAAIKSRAWGGREVEAWRRRWAWQFLEHPLSVAGQPSFLVIEAGGKPSGGIGWIPAVGAREGRPVSLAFACDIFVDRSLQRGGLGRALMATVAEQADITLFMNPSRTMLKFLRRHGYMEVRGVRQYFRIIQPLRLLAGRLGGGAESKPTESRPPSLATMQPDWPASGQVEDLARRAVGSSLGPVRNWRYIDWRYRQAPFGDYRVGSVSGETGLRALAVWRICQRRMGPIGVLSEMMVGPGAQSVGVRLIRSVVRDLRDSGAVVVKALATSWAARRRLLRAGFLPASAGPRLFLDPARAKGLPLRASGWNLSLGDGDLDYS